MTGLTEWQNFYVITGSAAGALIGLQFVVLALIAGMPRSAGLAQAGAAYSTPTIVYFATVLFLSAAMCAPWRGIAEAAWVWGAGGLVGAVYAVMITLRLRRQTAYRPELEDWLFHAALPLAAYGALTAAGVLGFAQNGAAVYCIAALTLLLLLIGIHNAWDSVTYHVFVKPPGQGNQ